MGKRFINGLDFANMVYSAADVLKAQVNTVNGLNVFPVPDGDTGTNMNMTLISGVEMLRKKATHHLGQNAEALSKGLLMGARGNSGVILSQIFRGVAKGAADLEEMNAAQFAAALQKGVDTAYQAVVKPVEGTILTVARESAKHGVQISRRVQDITQLMEEVLNKAKEALARTPEQLPVLKQVGVVDSGGQGLVFVYEGFLAALKQEEVPGAIDYTPIPMPAELPVVSAAAQELQEKAQSRLATEDIEFLYDMEFFIDIAERKVPGSVFDIEQFRQELAKDGDSILVIEDDQFVKVHVHSRKPGDVFNLAMQYGELSRFHIENMREQHRKIVDPAVPGSEEQSIVPVSGAVDGVTEGKRKFGIVAVAVGEGISEIFSSIGVDYVLSGGQTMNPSTEDIVQAIEKVNAEKVFVLPNNSNIILAAEQAKELVEAEVAVIPAKTIPQGMAAALAFQEGENFETNQDIMNRALSQVRSGQITKSIRQTTIDDVEIQEGDYLAILDSKITAASSDILEAATALFEAMIVSGDEVITILRGEDAQQSETDQMVQFIEERYPDVELDILDGGQPLYPYLFAVE
ncbi:DAK2 domain-containing protein [Marinicrinis lubricantis]|uniref:DAK2 domain-containing protein n=1 Tax=Marinicrinis lubricantis TaxID=2086470 RepID=A0ABW1IMM2_9BACL